MTKRRMQELRKLSNVELTKRLQELRLELLKERGQSRIGRGKNPMRIRQLRKAIARVLTVLRER